MLKSMNRLWVAAAFLALVMAAFTAVNTSQVFAADGYDYTIRISSGGEGLFPDGAKEITQTVQAGGSAAIDLDAMNVEVTDEKYYAKGLRAAGHDDSDNTIVRSQTISNVQADHAFVVVYGIKSTMVKYTVQYEDKDGNQLLPDAEYYGSVGDKPVVSFRYVSGYAPTAYNETKTLSEDEDQNVFVFRYYKSEVPVTVAPQTTQNTQVTQNNTANTVTPAGGGTQTPAGNANNTANANAGASANDNTAAQSAAVNEATPGTPDLVDLDDEDVPLAAPDASALANSDSSTGASNAIWFALIAAGLALIAVAIVFYRRRHSQRA